MDLRTFIQICQEWKETLLRNDEAFQEAKLKAQASNSWFTSEFIECSIHQICNSFLDPAKMESWLKLYPDSFSAGERKVGMVSAGNIPLVSFHDVLCALASNQKIYFKPSAKDLYLTKYVFDTSIHFTDYLKGRVEFVDRLPDVDACIITGSTSSTSYLKKYFAGRRIVVRGHRNSIAILNSDTTEHDLEALAKDVFMYFGLGCRNVCKIYIPRSFDVTRLLDVFDRLYGYLKDHGAYHSNYEYRLAVCLVNRQSFLQGESIIMIESPQLPAPVAVLNYEFYDSFEDLFPKLEFIENNIQCIVTNQIIPGLQTIPFGSTQNPELTSYQDHVDTMKFLLNNE